MMDQLLKKTGVFVVSGALLVATGCSFFGGPKENTKAPGEILDQAKAELGASFKDFVKSELNDYEKEYLATLKDWPNTGERTFTANVKAEGEGSGKVSLTEKFESDLSGIDSIDMDSTILDILKAAKGKAEFEIKIQADLGLLGKIEGAIEFTVIEENGVYYLALENVTVPEGGIPGGPSKQEVDAMVTAFKGQWIKVDFAQLIEENPLFGRLFEMKLRELNNVDPEVLGDLADAYVDDVVMKQSWLEVKEDSKQETDMGDEYIVVLTEENIKKFFEANYDFVEANLEDLDKVFDFTQKNNPFAVAPLTLDDIRDEIEGERENFKSSLDTQEFSDVELLATFAGDKLVKLGGEYEIPEGTAEGKMSVFAYFEDEMHDVKKMNLELRADVKEGENQSLNIVAKLHVLDGGDRSNTVDFDFKSDGIAAKADFVSYYDGESTDIKTVKFDADVDVEGEDEFDGLTASFNYDAGDDNAFDLMIQSKPDGKMLEVKGDGNFGKNKGEAELTFGVNPPKEASIEGGLGLDYKFEEKDVKFELPEAAADAQDMTPAVQQLINSALAGATDPFAPVDLSGGEVPFDATSGEIDYSQYGY